MRLPDSFHDAVVSPAYYVLAEPLSRAETRLLRLIGRQPETTFRAFPPPALCYPAGCHHVREAYASSLLWLILMVAIRLAQDWRLESLAGVRGHAAAPVAGAVGPDLGSDQLLSRRRVMPGDREGAILGAGEDSPIAIHPPAPCHGRLNKTMELPLGGKCKMRLMKGLTCLVAGYITSGFVFHVCANFI
ncbi:hypothetical protein PGQ11_009026 [Apiospora arundinis]|uniref:Uncharacterized protein n=1 Tax=Apiospora arundinis TaxID=335852 RepID=A0ABR2IHH5_9PEZI